MICLEWVFGHPPLATAILLSQKPEECVRCNAWADFRLTTRPWCSIAHGAEPEMLIRDVVRCQQCDKECRIKRPCNARTHASIRIGLRAVGAGLTSGVYNGAMAIAEDKPKEILKAVASTLLQLGDPALSAVAHTINTAAAIDSLFEARDRMTWLDVTLGMVCVIISTVQAVQGLDQAATEEALEALLLQQGGPIQHGASIDGKFVKNLQQAATGRDQIKVLYDHRFMRLEQMEWLLERLELLDELGEITETLDDIIRSPEELEAQKPNVVVERN